MNSSNGLRFLRPYLKKDLPAATKSAYLRFFSTSRALCLQDAAAARHAVVKTQLTQSTELRAKLQERIDELNKAGALEWPRIQGDKNTLRIADFNEKYDYLQTNDRISDHTVRINGRLKGFRVAGSKLVFLDLVQDGVATQVLLEKKSLVGGNEVDSDLFRSFYRLIRRGDVICRYIDPIMEKCLLITCSCFRYSASYEQWPALGPGS
jgi:lysyl-tRNA synthetase class 2